MIFVLDDSIKKLPISKLNVFARLLCDISVKNHFLRCSNEVWNWVVEQILQTNNYLGIYDKEMILKNSHLRDVTNMKKKYLSEVLVGDIENCISVDEAKMIVEKPSLIIVENKQNDWAAIKRIIDLMKNDRSYKEIFMIVCQRKDLAYLDADNAGSAGQVVNTIAQRSCEYKRTTPYKISVLIDSDKTSKTCNLSSEKKKIEQEMACHKIHGHILLKREMENYFPFETFKTAGYVRLSVAVPAYTDEDWDFYDIEHKPFIKYEKKFLPNLAQYLQKEELLSRLANEKVVYNSLELNEMQMVMFKLAKIC